MHGRCAAGTRRRREREKQLETLELCLGRLALPASAARPGFASGHIFCAAQFVHRHLSVRQSPAARRNGDPERRISELTR